MTIIEYTPHNLTERIQHRKKIRRMTDGLIPRNLEWAMLITLILVIAFFTLCIAVWWTEGAIAEGYDYNTYVRVVNAANGLWVRTGPGTEHTKSCMLGEGGKWLLKDTRPGWALLASVKYPDRLIGWVCSDYLEAIR